MRLDIRTFLWIHISHERETCHVRMPILPTSSNCGSWMLAGCGVESRVVVSSSTALGYMYMREVGGDSGDCRIPRSTTGNGNGR